MKKAISFILALVLCLGLAIPALATDIAYELPTGGTIYFDPLEGRINSCDKDSIVDFVVPDSIEGIEIVSLAEDLFFDSKKLKSAVISENIEYIGGGGGGMFVEYGTFAGCTKLEKIYIPKSVTKIQGYAFKECEKLTDIYYGGSMLDWAKVDSGATPTSANKALITATMHYNAKPGDVNPAAGEASAPATTTPTTPDPAPSTPSTPSTPTQQVHYHTMTHVVAKAATEQAEGNIEYWYCAGCGKYFLDLAGEREITQAQTVIPKLSPTHTHSMTHYTAKSASCTEGGNLEYWYCAGCGKYFSDANGALETTLARVTLAPLGHNFVDGVCTRDGVRDPNYTPSVEALEVHFPKSALYYQGQFADIQANQWFTGSVAEVYELGLMKGTSDDAFDPYGNVTLAQAITMAARIHAIYMTGTDAGFDQTSGGAWYQTYLDYAYNNGIISRAYFNGDVTREATRAQFAEIFANSLPAGALAPINTIADNAIPDVRSTDSFAEYVYKLYRAGILTGGDVSGTFSPQTYITRAEAAAIVSRMAESGNRKSFSLG